MAIIDKNGKRNYAAENNILNGCLGVIPGALVAGPIGAVASILAGIFCASKNIQRAEQQYDIMHSTYVPVEKVPVHAQQLSDEEKIDAFADFFKDAEVIQAGSFGIQDYNKGNYYNYSFFDFNFKDSPSVKYNWHNKFYIPPQRCMFLENGYKLDNAYEVIYNLKNTQCKKYIVSVYVYPEGTHDRTETLMYVVLYGDKAYLFYDWLNNKRRYSGDTLMNTINQKYGMNLTMDYNKNTERGYKRSL